MTFFVDTQESNFAHALSPGKLLAVSAAAFTGCLPLWLWRRYSPAP